jgi:glycosyltransferase involved in cell wall biosynthesis
METEMGEKVIVVMPAYNAEATVEKTVRDMPLGSYDEIILVDDCSKDRTAEVARGLGLTVIQHRKNRGYGGNQKTCYDTALEHGADYVVMIHPDYQYDSRLLPYVVGFLKTGICDVLLGSRIRTRAQAIGSGMPPIKYYSNRFLTIVENVIMGQNLAEWHSGYRAYNRKALETIPYNRNSDDFVFDAQFLAQAVHFGFEIGDVPVPCRYMEEASSINLRRSITYGVGCLRVAGRFWLHEHHLLKYGPLAPKRAGE